MVPNIDSSGTHLAAVEEPDAGLGPVYVEASFEMEVALRLGHINSDCAHLAAVEEPDAGLGPAVDAAVHEERVGLLRVGLREKGGNERV